MYSSRNRVRVAKPKRVRLSGYVPQGEILVTKSEDNLSVLRDS